MRVKFWPKQNNIPVTKCNHRFGALMTFSDQTDSRYESSIYALELFGFRHNVRNGAFVTNLMGQYNDGLREQEDTGLLRNDIYYATDRWKNPTTGAIELIPDYTSTTWTASGAEFFDVTVGSAKNVRTPRHGQQMYNLSSGRLGYDFVNGIMGENQLQEVYGLDDDMQDWFYSVLGRYPSSLSYRNGDNSGALTHFKNWISGRNSFPSPQAIENPAPTQYGSMLGHPSVPTSRDFFLNYPSSHRWWDGITYNGIPREDMDAYVLATIQDTKINGGWEREFKHVHSARDNGTLPMLDEFYQLIRSGFGSDFVWTCSNGEAMEYMFLREITNRVSAVEKDGRVYITADIVDKFKELNTSGLSQILPLNRINIPLSVEVDLSGTSLAGKSIKPSSGKARSLGSNKYIIEIPFNHKELFQSVVIEEGEGGVYETSVPSATTTIDGNRLTVTTNMPTKAVIFSVSAGGNDYDSLPEGRSNKYSTVHTFDKVTGKDYRVGIISEFLQANLIEI